MKNVKVEDMKAALFPGRIAFTMTRFNLLRLAWGALRAALLGAPGIAISVGDLEVIADER